MSINGEYMKPLPPIDEDSVEFWEAAKRHVLMIQRCENCGTYYFPASYCNKCNIGFTTPWATNMQWVNASGKGRVLSFTVIHHPYVPTFKDDIPYNVAIIELEEGPLMQSSIVDCDNEDIRAGMPVEVVFEDVTKDITLPKWKPISVI